MPHHKTAAAQTFFAQGKALQAQGLRDKALAAYECCLHADAGFWRAANNIGVLHLQAGAFAAAAAALTQAISLQPNYAGAWYNRGMAEHALSHYETAIADFARALALHERGEPAAACKTADQALVGTQAGADALTQLASDSLQNLHWCWGQCLLCLGRWREAWPHYEWRRQEPGFLMPFPYPRWQSLAAAEGKTLLLFYEQGLGDTLQCLRYVPLAAAYSTHTVLCVQPPLFPLVKANLSRKNLQVIAPSSPLPHIDWQCPLLSLPGLFATTPDNIPPPLTGFHAAAEKISAWRERLPVGKRLIGLAWSGNAAHPHDGARNIPLAILLAALPPRADTGYVVLQKEIPEQDLALLTNRPDCCIAAECLSDFSETAALCSLMTQVISVDTSIAHLAGSLGCSVHLALPKVADWRWGQRGETTAWYPSARLYRQSAEGDWACVAAAIAAAAHGAG